MMAWFSRKVLVTFVDDANNAVIATSNMQPENLPESFKIDTALHLNDADWSVIHAEPQSRKEYTKSGTLTLRLRKVEKMAVDSIYYSQLDITERFDDNLNLGADDWIPTTPLNSTTPNPESSGLPSPDANVEEVYRVGAKMSDLRESIPIPNDGVYCPVCHIANIDLAKLRTPCPQCGRGLLKFGWD